MARERDAYASRRGKFRIGAQEDQYGNQINYDARGNVVPLGPNGRPVSAGVGATRPHQDSDNIPMSQPYVSELGKPIRGELDAFRPQRTAAAMVPGFKYNPAADRAQKASDDADFQALVQQGYYSPEGKSLKPVPSGWKSPTAEIASVAPNMAAAAGGRAPSNAGGAAMTVASHDAARGITEATKPMPTANGDPFKRTSTGVVTTPQAQPGAPRMLPADTPGYINGVQVDGTPVAGAQQGGSRMNERIAAPVTAATTAIAAGAAKSAMGGVVPTPASQRLASDPVPPTPKPAEPALSTTVDKGGTIAPAAPTAAVNPNLLQPGHSPIGDMVTGAKTWLKENLSAIPGSAPQTQPVAQPAATPRPEDEDPYKRRRA